MVKRNIFIDSFEIDMRTIIFPFLWNSEETRVRFYSYIFLNKYQNVALGKERLTEYINNCYFGLSLGSKNSYDLNEEYYLLNQLSNSTQINQKVFSFDKWNINQNSILTNFYFGDIHENFKSNKEILALVKI